MPRSLLDRRDPFAGGFGHPFADGAGRVIIVSNRLPMTASVRLGGVRLHRSTGGLASGLRGVQERSRGLWIGWSGVSADEPDVRRTIDEQLAEVGAVAVPLDEAEIDGFYRRYANGVLWPVLHGFPARDELGAWTAYVRANHRYADAVARHAKPGDRIWIHDYHLMLVPELLRQRRPDVRIGFFLHTPFPSSETFATVPHAPALLRGLLGADVVGVHTREYARNFLGAVQAMLPNEIRGDDITVGDRTVSAFACPLGIDVDAFAGIASSPSVITETRRLRSAEAGAVLLGVDRLDYTKGIPSRLLAFEKLLETRPALRGRIRLRQLAVPSREDVGGYPEIRAEVESIAARINSTFGRSDWTPVDYQYRSVGLEELVSLYCSADVMLVTPLRDGMNLVAKEFVASRIDDDGVLILSECAGAAAELRAALRVDPTDVAALAGTYESALTMLPAERRVRMRRLRRAVESNDVYRWAGLFVDALRR
ncbi:MAG: trehalose-6-phosphate synthase [bacterium]